MSEPTPLPGLEVAARPPGPVEVAARRTITALNASGLISERDALLCQSLLSISRAYDIAAASTAKAYAVANLHAQLLATLAVLPTAQGGDDDADPWTAFERNLARGASIQHTP
ncbi:MAG: hypothetical protein QM597_06815 [Aeromicrobium sp.]|uniref:hypothetical protein n=1 Tax=Aeromicrobium sp. TaxID=1871063 RepID=UPI0039E2CB0A